MLTFLTFAPPPPQSEKRIDDPAYSMALYTRHYTDKTLKLREIYECASERSERALKFWHFHNLKLLFPSSFCWYFRYFLSDTFIFRSQITSAYIKQSMHFPYITYGMMLYINDSIPTNHLHWENVCDICERAERASFKNFAISHSNTAISLNILLVLQILCFRNIFNFRCQHSPYIYNQCSFLLLLMVWCYI